MDKRVRARMDELQSDDQFTTEGRKMAPDARSGSLQADAIESILAVTSEFLYIEDVETLLQKILATVARTFGLAKAHIGIKSRKTGLYEIRACYGYPPHVVSALKKIRYTQARMDADLREEFRVGRNSYYVPAEANIMEPEEVFFISHPERIEQPRASPDDWLELDYIDFLMYERDGSPMGYLEVDEPIDRKVPGDDVLKAIEVFSDLAAIAIQNSELYEQKAMDRKEIGLLIDLIGHDVYNYTQAVVGYIELAMQMGDLSEHARKCLVKAHDQVNSLNNLISKVKLYSKVEDAGAEKKVRIDLVPVIKHSFEDARLYYPGKSARLELADETPRLCRLNELGKEIFLNLFSNAIKFDEHEEVVVQVSIDDCRIDGLEGWCVSIVDRGPGIPDEVKSSIFDRFTRSKRDSIGTGLGLHIAKTLVVNHGGRLWVEDREWGRHSQGSVFKIALPKAIPGI